MSENTSEIQAKGRFQKGKSGNPNGKPKGARNQSTLLAERLLGEEIEGVCQSVIIEATAGNMQAARIILDRLLPPRKDSPIKLDLPKIESSAELLKAIGCVTDAVGSGQITPSEGEALSRIIDIHSRALELTEFEQRLTVLEQRAGNESIK